MLSTLTVTEVKKEEAARTELWGSVDGQSYRPLPQVDPAEGVHGLRSRALSLGGVPVRFLRIGDGVGDNAYSISEVAAYCQLPVPFPPKMRVVPAPVPPGEESKSLAEVERLCRLAARAGLRRADAVLALGGGVVGDLAGFVAGT